ncbi:MAG: hypothetical protein OXC91_15210, partial [Rhodobacteraceae bacterium]|nr:hypothetical protein [Paracoccaceae bacterium]
MVATARTISGRTLTLTVSPAITPGQAATIVYAPPTTASQRMQDAAGNEVQGFTTIANLAADDDPALTGTPAVSGRTVVLDVDPAIGSEDTVRLAYAQPTAVANRLQDAAGNQVAAFSNFSAQEGQSGTETGTDRYSFGWTVVAPLPPPPTSGSDEYTFGWTVVEPLPPPPTAGDDEYSFGWTVVEPLPPPPTAGDDDYTFGWVVVDPLPPPPTTGSDEHSVSWVVVDPLPPPPTTGTDEYSFGWSVVGGAVVGRNFITLQIEPAGDPGQLVRVTYRLPTAKGQRLQDAAANDVAQFTIQGRVPLQATNLVPPVLRDDLSGFIEQTQSVAIIHDASQQVVGQVPYLAGNN